MYFLIITILGITLLSTYTHAAEMLNATNNTTIDNIIIDDTTTSNTTTSLISSALHLGISTCYSTDPIPITVDAEYRDHAAIRITGAGETYRIQDPASVDTIILTTPGQYAIELYDKNDGTTISTQTVQVLPIPIQIQKSTYMLGETVFATIDESATLFEIRNLDTGDNFIPIDTTTNTTHNITFTPSIAGTWHISVKNILTNREYEQTFVVSSAQDPTTQDAPTIEQNTTEQNITTQNTTDAVTESPQNIEENNSFQNNSQNNSENNYQNITEEENKTLTENKRLREIEITNNFFPKFTRGQIDESIRTKLISRFKNINIEDIRTVQTAHGNRHDLRLQGIGNNRVEMRGAIINDSTNTTFQAARGTSTDIIRVDNAQIENGATVELAKNSNVDAIARCEQFNQDGICTKWVKTNIPFIDLGDRIIFNVTHFSGYAGVINSTYYYIENNTILNISGTTNLTRLTLTINDPNASQWLIVAYGNFRINATTAEARMYLQSNGTEVAMTAKRGTAVTEVNHFYYSYIYTGNGATQTFTLNASANATSARMDILGSRLIAIRIDGLPNTDYNSTYDGTTSLNVNNAWNDEVNDTVNIAITPASAGVYLIGGAAAYHAGNITGFAQMRLRLNNSDIKATLFEQDVAITEWHNANFMSIENLQATPYNITLELTSNSSAAADWQDKSLYVIRLSDVFNFWAVNQSAEATTTTTRRFVINITNTTYASHNYTIFSSALVRINATNRIITPNTYAQYNKIDNQSFQPKNINDYVSSGTFDQVTNVAIIRANMSIASSNAAATARMSYADLFVLELGNYPDPIILSNAQINVTGPAINGTKIKLNISATNDSNFSKTVVEIDPPLSAKYNATLTQNGNEWYNDTITLNESGIWNFTFYFTDAVGFDANASTASIDCYMPRTINLSTNASIYYTNETIGVKGAYFWINGTAIANKNVTVIFYNSTGSIKQIRNVTTNNSGNYNDTFNLSTTTEAGVWSINISGLFNVTTPDDNSTTFTIYKIGLLTINITSPLNNTNIPQNTTFLLNFSITCAGGDYTSCGLVNITARRNTSTQANFAINFTSTTPLKGEVSTFTDWYTSFSDPFTADTWITTATDSQKNIFIASKCDGCDGTTFDGAYQVELAKYYQNGTLAWNSSYNATTLSEVPAAMTIDSQNNIIIVANLGYGSGYMMPSVYKIAANGTLIWNKNYTVSNDSYTNDIATDLNDSIILVGATNNRTAADSGKLFILKIYSNSTYAWNITEDLSTGSMPNGDDQATSVAIDNNNSIIIGAYYSALFVQNATIEKYLTSGTNVWRKNFTFAAVNDIYVDQNNISWMANRDYLFGLYSNGSIYSQQSIIRAGGLFNNVNLVRDGNQNKYLISLDNSGATYRISKFNSTGSLLQNITFNSTNQDGNDTARFDEINDIAIIDDDIIIAGKLWYARLDRIKLIDSYPVEKILTGNQTYNLTLEINATGTLNSKHLIDILLTSDLPQIGSINSTDIVINIAPNGAIPTLIIENVTPSSSVNPISGQNTSVTINFTATDSVDAARINDSSARFIINKSSVTRNGTCTATILNSTSKLYNCSISIPFYDEAGLWNINVSVSNNQSLNASNATTIFTYNTLVSIGVSSPSYNFGSIAPGAANQAGTSNPLQIANLGNVNVTGFNITAYDLSNTTFNVVIRAGNMTANTTNAAGIKLLNATQVAIANSTVAIRNDTMWLNRSIYFYISMPTGLPAGVYSSQSKNWVITTNE